MTIDPRNAPYFADGTGATDATGPLNAAIAAAVGVTDIDVSYGTFKLASGPLVVGGPLWMHGGNEHATTFQVASPTAPAIEVTTNAPFHFEKFTCAPLSGSQTAGAMIQTIIASGSNNESSIERVRLINPYNGFDLTGCAYFSLIGGYVNGWVDGAVIITNPAQVDAGDSVIDRFFALKSGSGGTAIWQASSGGLRIENSKFLGGDFGYQMALAAGASTGTLLINGNSFEGQRLSGVYMDHGVGSTFVMVEIVGNEFESQNTPIQIATADNTVWCRGVTISGNTIYLAATGGEAIMINGAAIGTIDGNNVYQNGGTTYGIYLGAHANNWRVGPHGLVGVTNPSVNLGTGDTITL